MTFPLAAADYYQLRAYIRDVEMALVDLDRLRVSGLSADTEVRDLLSARAKAAVLKRDELFLRLAQEHGFDPQRVYRWNDDGCELIVHDE